MSIFKDALDRAKHAIIEDDGKDTAAEQLQVPIPSRSPQPLSIPIAPTPISPQASPEADADIYSTLKSKTDFDATDVGILLRRFVEPLKVLNLDERTTLKSAVLQAGAQSGLTQERIIAAFNSMVDALNDEKASFQRGCAGFVAAEITGKLNLITQISKDIDLAQANLQKLLTQKSDFSQQLDAAKVKLDCRQNAFTRAASRRANEIDAEKAHYTDLLKG